MLWRLRVTVVSLINCRACESFRFGRLGAMPSVVYELIWNCGAPERNWSTPFSPICLFAFDGTGDCWLLLSRFHPTRLDVTIAGLKMWFQTRPVFTPRLKADEALLPYAGGGSAKVGGSFSWWLLK